MLDRLKPTRILLGLALVEVIVDRVAVPLLKPLTGAPPGWHTALAYLGLFAFYFTGTLALVVAGLRVVDAFVQRDVRRSITAGILGFAALVAAIPLVISEPPALGVVREIAFGVGVIALVASAIGRTKDRGIQFGLGLISLPLLLHVVDALGTYFLWPDQTFDGPGLRIQQVGVFLLAFAALATPYCFAPRPFARAVTRPGPVLVAMAVAAVGAVASRMWYPIVAKAATLAIGVELAPGQSDPRLALYLLAIATLVWTLASCATSPSEQRRNVGIGLLFIVLGGYGFKYPNHYLLPLLGLALIAEAARSVREEELDRMPIEPVTKPIPDAVWSGYITTVAQSLKRSFDEVHSLTARGDDGMSSSMIVGERAGLAVRLKIQRVEGSVFSLDVVVGREIDELRGASLTLWAIPERGTGVNPPAPVAGPMLRAGDDAFDARFRCRGSTETFATLLDPDLRARATATLDGWLAYWQGEGLRWRVYPGHGAPIDHPMPLSDLALGRTGAAERLVAVIELLAEIGARGIPRAEPVAAMESESA